MSLGSEEDIQFTQLISKLGRLPVEILKNIFINLYPYPEYLLVLASHHKFKNLITVVSDQLNSNRLENKQSAKSRRIESSVVPIERYDPFASSSSSFITVFLVGRFWDNIQLLKKYSTQVDNVIIVRNYKSLNLYLKDENKRSCESFQATDAFSKDNDDNDNDDHLLYANDESSGISTPRLTESIQELVFSDKSLTHLISFDSVTHARFHGLEIKVSKLSLPKVKKLVFEECQFISSGYNEKFRINEALDMLRIIKGDTGCLGPFDLTKYPQKKLVMSDMVDPSVLNNAVINMAKEFIFGGDINGSITIFGLKLLSCESVKLGSGQELTFNKLSAPILKSLITRIGYITYIDTNLPNLKLMITNGKFVSFNNFKADEMSKFITTCDLQELSFHQSQKTFFPNVKSLRLDNNCAENMVFFDSERLESLVWSSQFAQSAFDKFVKGKKFPSLVYLIVDSVMPDLYMPKLKELTVLRVISTEDLSAALNSEYPTVKNLFLYDVSEDDSFEASFDFIETLYLYSGYYNFKNKEFPLLRGLFLEYIYDFPDDPRIIELDFSAPELQSITVSNCNEDSTTLSIGNFGNLKQLIVDRCKLESLLISGINELELLSLESSEIDTVTGGYNDTIKINALHTRDSVIEFEGTITVDQNDSVCDKFLSAYASSTLLGFFPRTKVNLGIYDQDETYIADGYKTWLNIAIKDVDFWLDV